MSNELERIQKWLAARGLGSRREIEGWIREGRLRVNGKPAELGQRISGYERLSLDGKPLRVSPEREAPRQVLMYHKPPGEICSRNDPDGRPSRFEHRRIAALYQRRRTCQPPDAPQRRNRARILGAGGG